MQNIFPKTASALILTEIAPAKSVAMISDLARKRLLHAMHLIKVAAGVLLLVAFSWEILEGKSHRISDTYLRIQLDVCLLYLADFLLGWLLAPYRARYFVRHLFYLLLSIPWLNLIAWSGVELSRPWSIASGLLPVLLLGMALYFLIDWIDEVYIHRLFFTYLCGTMLFTYLAALIFYEVEAGNSNELHGFGDALWWAGVNLTTAGASVIPTTTIGKLLSVLLPLVGMLFLPIFTSYIIQRYSSRKSRSGDNSGC